MMGYVCIKLLGMSLDNNWHHLTTGWGIWYLVELVGFVIFPALLFAVAKSSRGRFCQPVPILMSKAALESHP